MGFCEKCIKSPVSRPSNGQKQLNELFPGGFLQFPVPTIFECTLKMGDFLAQLVFMVVLRDSELETRYKNR